jgi:hypothetical protein
VVSQVEQVQKRTPPSSIVMETASVSVDPQVVQLVFGPRVLFMPKFSAPQGLALHSPPEPFCLVNGD